MLDPGIQAEFDRQFKTIQVLYYGMLASLAGYLGVGLVLGSNRPPGASGVSPQLVRILYGLSILLIAAAFLVKRQMVRPIPMSSTTEEIKSCLTTFRMGHLLSYVLCESIGVMGLLGLLLGGSRNQFINLVLVAFALMVVLRPKRIDSSIS